MSLSQIPEVSNTTTFKVVRSIPAKSISATSTEFLFGFIVEHGSPEEYVKGNFLTENDALNFAKGKFENDPSTKWKYDVRQE